MKTFVTLLRGINVGGNNSLPMKSFAALLEGLGASAVKTYIQSGNAVFQSPKLQHAALQQQITAAIQKDFGFAPWVLVLPLQDYCQALTQNPFPNAESLPNSLHVGFLAQPPKAPDLARMDAIKTSTEQYQLIGRAFYLHAPDGVGRSKLAASAERLIGVDMTMRNWRSCCAIRDLATT